MRVHTYITRVMAAVRRDGIARAGAQLAQPEETNHGKH